ncbi:M56 family metallopeptidase [Algoriphagus mannitolivorans]|uniref:M56 family metallopeptidase n=1 Tax=Algoriphagus mannitolivorans TaxID=226504 RepID=UPI000424481C|nr:M56 family metallopeptidase [Algoriphagus mannitolivorans]
MEFLNELLPEELLKSLGWTLVHSLWQLIAIAALFWLSLRIFKNQGPSFKYNLGVGALVFSFFMALGTFIYEFSTYEKIPPINGARLEAFVFQGNTISTESTVDTFMTLGVTWIETSLPILVNIWFLGALLFLVRLLNSLSEIRLLKKTSSPVSDFELEKVMYRLVGKLNITRDVKLKISRRAISPLTFGTLKPIILLPAGLVFQLSPAQLEAILAHELAHVKRNDYLINLLLSSLEVIFFFHPCYWWMSSAIQELRENAADDLVVKSGVEAKNLATGLAEVLNFSKQNPPELALAAGKKHHPTLQRIKRILGYPSQNYPQTPIISIPMLLTLFLSIGLMASAQQDAPKPNEPIAPKTRVLDVQPTFVSPAPQDTTVKSYRDPKTKEQVNVYGKNVMIMTTADGKTYQIKGDMLISEGDTVILSPKAKAAWERLRLFDSQNMPELVLPEAPEFPEALAMVPEPDFDFQFDMPEMPPMPMENFDFPELMDVPLDFDFKSTFPDSFFRKDTTKMTQEERAKWQKEIQDRAREFSKEAELRAKEWEAKWKENESERKEKMAQWEAKFKEEFEPRLKEFEARMKEWQAQNEPKMKEFEAKMKEWQKAQEPKMKEWEAKMKDWETAQKPKMEEFQRKMEIWQKEHQAKMDEFQKLLQEELKKDKN